MQRAPERSTLAIPVGVYDRSAIGPQGGFRRETERFEE